MNDNRSTSKNHTSNVSDEVLCQEILELLKRFKAALARIAEVYGLTTMQLAALRAIHEGHDSMGRLAKTMYCDASNVTGIVDRLVATRMVTRQEAAYDRRVKTLGVTPAGQAIIDRISRELPRELGCDRLRGTEKTALYGALRTLSDS